MDEDNPSFEDLHRLLRRSLEMLLFFENMCCVSMLRFIMVVRNFSLCFRRENHLSPGCFILKNSRNEDDEVENDQDETSSY